MADLQNVAATSRGRQERELNEASFLKDRRTKPAWFQFQYTCDITDAVSLTPSGSENGQEALNSLHEGY
jgi:hypothetical protein